MGNMQRLARALKEESGAAKPGKPLAELKAARSAHVHRALAVAKVMAIGLRIIRQTHAIRCKQVDASAPQAGARVVACTPTDLSVTDKLLADMQAALAVGHKIELA